MCLPLFCKQRCLPKIKNGMINKLNEKIKQFFETTKKWSLDHLHGIDIFDEHYIDKAKTNPWYILGSLVWLFWMITIVSGCILMAIYIPSITEAYDSIIKIQNEIPFGGFMRGIHKYGADALIIAATIRLYRIFISADYKGNRELTVAVSLLTLLLGMYSGLTGYLLIWNQRAFWATKVFATFPTYVDQFWIVGPTFIGGNTSQILLGGSSIGQATMTRFYSLHVAFTLIALIAYELYIYKTGFKRLNISWAQALIPILMVCIASIILPAQAGHRADPNVTPLPILSDWYFLALYQFYKYIEPVWATALTVLIPLTVVILPFFDFGVETSIFKRPIFLAVCFMGFTEFIVFSILIILNVANIHTDPPVWRAYSAAVIGMGIIWQYILHKIQRPEKLFVALLDFVAYVVIPIFVMYWSFPFLLNGFRTVEAQIIGMLICLIPAVIAYSWHLFFRRRLTNVEVAK